ncbi:ATP-dependent translocase ABCB1-like [Achroia grisella]|uniref:ATP-dependent translocase ABCB1-like n=1 Tax=Achroia grisella TaxID=688607 RepID=UPI0027D28D5B|nr:ATP-dependent translocase ABCB1-like [Achroia grisella]
MDDADDSCGTKLNKTKEKYTSNDGTNKHEMESLLVDKSDNIKITPTSKSEEVEEDTKHDIPSISFFTLFRFASIKDKIFITIALLSSVICGCTTPVCVLLFSYLSQNMVSYGISLNEGKPNDEAFYKALFYYAISNTLVAVTFVFFTYVATVLMNVAAYNQVYRIRQEYFKAVLNQDFAYFDTHQMGDFAEKMTSDAMKVEDGIGEKVATCVYYLTGSVSTFLMALALGWKLALLCLISFPIQYAVLGLSGWISAKLSVKETEATGKAGAVAEEVLSSIRTVYAFNGQEKEIERYQSLLKVIRKINIKKGFYNALTMGLLFLCIFSSYALAFWFGYVLIVNDPETYDVSTMLSVFLGVLMASENFAMLQTLIVVFGVASGAGAQIFNLIDNVPTINPLKSVGVTPKSSEGNIEFKNVVFNYPSKPDVPVLKGVSLKVNHGQSAALVGHSGCGKSTVIQLISRYYDVAKGTVTLDGNDVRDLSVRWLREQIGLVSQEPVLFNTTIRENIRYGREDATEAQIESCARQANAHHFIIKLPKGYDTVVGERGASLSGGQKQRVAIARALIRNPRVLLLDEATSALDISSEAKVQKALDKAQEGRTTIIVAHRLSTIRHVDIIYVFKNGEIIESGNHNDLMKKKGHYYDMVMIQTSDPEAQDNDKPVINRQQSEISNNLDEDELKDIITVQEEKEPEETEQETSFWEILRLNGPEWKSVTLASISSLFSGFAMPMFGVIIGDYIGVFSNADEDEMLLEVRRLVFTFIIIGVLSGFANFITIHFYGVAGEYLTERLRKRMFGTLLQQDVAYYDNKDNSTGALCARLAGEAAAVQAATGQRIGTLLQAAGTLILALVISLYYEYRVGLVALVFVPIIAGVFYKERQMAGDESSGTAKAMEASSKLAVDAVSNVRTVASLGKEKMFLNCYSILLLPGLQIAKRASHWRGIVFGLSRGLMNFTNAIALYYGGTLIINEHIDYAIIMKAAQAILISAGTAAQAFAFAPNFHKGIKAAGRVVVLLNLKSKIIDPAEPNQEFNGNGTAALKNIHFKYPSRPDVEVLKHMDLEINKGKTVALVGASGCGKSTVIQLLERYYDPDMGVVTQNDIPIKNLTLADARKTIGFVQQEPILFDRTIGENIAYGDNSRQPSMDEIIEAAKQANIHNFIISLPSGYDTNVGSKGSQLSGGQKQRVAIARALIRHPQILILDEATSALDTESEKVVQEALLAASAGRTCVTIAHRLSTVRDADRICVLSSGRMHETGTHAQLMQLKGLYYDLNKAAI